MSGWLNNGMKIDCYCHFSKTCSRYMRLPIFSNHNSHYLMYLCFAQIVIIEPSPSFDISHWENDILHCTGDSSFSHFSSMIVDMPLHISFDFEWSIYSSLLLDQRFGFHFFLLFTSSVVIVVFYSIFIPLLHTSVLPLLFLPCQEQWLLHQHH